MNALATQWDSFAALHGAGAEPRRAGMGVAWEVASYVRVGRRHRRSGLPCEDVAGVRMRRAGTCNAAVADGVSGGVGGDVAAHAAVEFLLGLGGDELRARLHELDPRIRTRLALHFGSRPGAATAAAAWLDAQGHGWCTRVGDCRVYRWSHLADGGLFVQQIGRDQTFEALGEVPPRGVPRTNPSRMAGNGRLGRPELYELQLAPGEGLLLCSDGVHLGQGPEAIRAALEFACDAGDTSLRWVSRIAREARLRGSEDDISVVAVRLHRPQKLEG